jgi:CheY-like chemotaxis protein
MPGAVELGQDRLDQAEGRTLTILVVEDDEAVAELLRALLNRVPGWGATVVHDASAAAEVFRHVEVEVLVVDVNLPGISGPELLEHLRARPEWRHPPVVLMSAQPEQPLVREALERAEEHHEPVQFLAKPFDVDDLVDAIARAVEALRYAGRGRSWHST